MVPVVTGTPACTPGSWAAASAVSVPAASPDQRSAGSGRPGATASAQGVCQAPAARSYSGATWLAEAWSST